MERITGKIIKETGENFGKIRHPRKPTIIERIKLFFNVL
jgi:hypothetical protein